MSYYNTRTVTASYDEALKKIEEELKKEGFGVLTQIDVAQTLKAKIGADFKRYKILGACNPTFAHQALQAEDKIGVLLPCNVIVEETADGGAEVSAVNPLESMRAVGNPKLEAIAGQVAERLQRVLDRL